LQIFIIIFHFYIKKNTTAASVEMNSCWNKVQIK
jgi:hypothetical protein